jgi:hypothetical protein
MASRRPHGLLKLVRMLLSFIMVRAQKIVPTSHCMEIPLSCVGILSRTSNQFGPCFDAFQFDGVDIDSLDAVSVLFAIDFAHNALQGNH